MRLDFKTPCTLRLTRLINRAAPSPPRKSEASTPTKNQRIDRTRRSHEIVLFSFYRLQSFNSKRLGQLHTTQFTTNRSTALKIPSHARFCKILRNSIFGTDLTKFDPTTSPSIVPITHSTYQSPHPSNPPQNLIENTPSRPQASPNQSA